MFKVENVVGRNMSVEDLDIEKLCCDMTGPEDPQGCIFWVVFLVCSELKKGEENW